MTSIDTTLATTAGTGRTHASSTLVRAWLPFSLAPH